MVQIPPSLFHILRRDLNSNPEYLLKFLINERSEFKEDFESTNSPRYFILQNKTQHSFLLKIYNLYLIKNNMKEKNVKIAGMLLYVILASLLVYLIKPAYLYSILIVLVPPMIVNFLWLKKSRKKVLIFSIALTLFFALAVELVSRLADAWDVQSILPRIFGIMPLENILFAFINFFWVLSFYEYFIDRDTTKKISKKFKYLVGFLIVFSTIIFSIYFLDPTFVAMNYVTVAIITLLVPSIIIYSRNLKLLKKTFVPVIFFSIIFFIYEIVSLLIGSWWWPGKYLVPINLFGNIFPIDDVIIWYFLSTITLIGGYEFFADDFK